MKNTEIIQNQYFIFGLISGTFAVTFNLLDVLTWETIADVFIRINLHTLLFFSFLLCFYFWYKHYSKVDPIFKTKKKIGNTNLIEIFFILAILAEMFSYLLFLLNLTYLTEFFWTILNLEYHPGRIVTIVSHITFLGGIVYIFIGYTILKNNLLELEKFKILELISITLIGITNLLLFINNIFITYSLYDLSVAGLFVNIGLLLFFLSLLLLISNYILVNPSHVQNPSIYSDIGDNLNFLADKNLLFQKEINFNTDSLEIPQKLNGTCILILIYLLRYQTEKDLMAKDLETILKLNKSTISYNLKILEKNQLIERVSAIQSLTNQLTNQDKEITLQGVDQRQKIISINDYGIKFLQILYQHLSNIF